MVFVTLPALKDHAHKATIVKESVQLEHGPTTVDAIVIALPNTQPMMLVLKLAQEEHHLSMEFVKLEVNHALQDNSGIHHPVHAKAVNIHAVSVL